MRPDDRALRKLLQSDAARVPIPEEMWSNIASRLQAEQKLSRRRRVMEAVLLQARPVMAFAAAIGVFWLAVAPLGYLSEKTEPSAGVIARVVAPARQDLSIDSGPYLTPIQQPSSRVTRPRGGGTSSSNSQHGLILAH